jgi:FkbM family methyltransferase
MKKIIISIVPPIFISLFKKVTNGRKKYYSVNDLDKKLEKYLNFDYGYFVELGANDGVTQSNSLYFEKHRNWKGVLVEPSPNNYLKCKSNRSTESNVFCCACTSFLYKEKFVEIAYSNLMTSPLGLESDIINPIDHAKSGNIFLSNKEDNFIFGALAIPLNNLLIQAGSPSLIDFLSLDVEGAEIEVLKGINHKEFRFKYMCIETRDVNLLAEYLKTQKYELFEKLSSHDYLFKNIA